MRKAICCSVIAIAIATAAPSASLAQSCNTANRSVALILDASGSMNARLPSGDTRMAAAQRAVKGVAALVPGKAQLMLRLYGAQSPASKKDCEDTHVGVPFGAAETLAPSIARAVDGAKAQGYTPIAFSLEKAAADFPAGAKERVIVLVSDGKETCKGDPVVTAKALASQGITVHAIGFVADSAAQMQLKSIARSTGGSYFDAPAGTELPQTLRSALEACKQKAPAKPASPKPGKLRTTAAKWLSTHPVIDAASGKEVGKLDSMRMEIPLPAGVYEVQFGPATWKGIEVRAGETTTIEPATLRVAKNVDADVVDSETGAVHARLDRMMAEVVVMPGVYDLKFAKTAWPFIKLDGGKTVTLDPVEVRMLPDSQWSSAQVLQGGQQVAVFDRVTYVNMLPPGEYIVEIDGKKHPFSAPKGGEVFEHK